MDMVLVKGWNFPRCEICNMQIANAGSLHHEQKGACKTRHAIWVQHKRAAAGYWPL